MNAPAQREHFLKERREGLGGSDVAAALGFSKFKTPVELWHEKTGRTAEDVDSMRLRFGNYNEQFVAQEYTNTTGLAVQRYNPMLRSEQYPHVIGHIDRLVIPRGQKVAAHRGEIRTDRGLEAKTVDGYVFRYSGEWGEPGTDEVPTYYLIQSVVYMALTGCQFWDLAALVGSGAAPLAIYQLQRDMDLELEIMRRAGEWWETHVIRDISPEPINDNDVSLLYPQAEAKVRVVATDEMMAEVRRIARVKALMKRLEADVSARTLEVKKFMAGAGELVSPEDEKTKLATWNNRKGANRFDLDSFIDTMAPGALPDEHAAWVADIKQAFTRRGEPSRSFLIK